MSRQESDFGVVLDFYLLEILTPFSTRVPLRLFKAAMGALAGLAAVLLLMFALALFALSRPLVADRPGAASGLLVVMVTANLYIGGSYLLREMFSERRFVVAASANASFFRALDIRACDVFTVYSGIRTTAVHVGLLLVDAAFVGVFRTVSDLPVARLSLVFALPAVSYVGTLAVSAWMAGRRPAAGSLRGPALPPLALTCFAVGYATARFIAEPLLDHGLAGAFGAEQVRQLLGLVAVGTPIVAAVSGFVLIRGLRRLARHPFPIHSDTGPVRNAPESARRWIPGKLLVLHREVASSKAYPLLRRNFLVLAAAVFACLGASASASVLPLGGHADRFHLSLQGFALVTFIVMVALVFQVVGPVTLAAQFRFEWEELLISRWRIAAWAATYYLLPVLALALGISVLLALVIGTWSIGPLVLAAVVAAAAMIAESLITPREMADGSNAQGTVVAVVVLLLAVPAFAAIAAGSLAFDCLAVLYSLCLVTGAIGCMAKKITTLPLRSAM